MELLPGTYAFSFPGHPQTSYAVTGGAINTIYYSGFQKYRSLLVGATPSGVGRFGGWDEGVGSCGLRLAVNRTAMVNGTRWHRGE